MAAVAWRAVDGEPISRSECPDLKDSDLPFAELPWGDTHDSTITQTSNEQSIVQVLPGDGWDDLRPSRPADFVGRQRLIERIRQFVLEVRENRTKSRVIGIKGKSGWGKSSLAIKLADELRDISVVLPVDCRAARSANYPDMAIYKSVGLAHDSVNLGPLFGSNIVTSMSPFASDSSYQEIFKRISNNGRTILVIFDQFEEIIHRDDIGRIFERFRELSLSLEESSAPVIIAYSWKTDGTTRSSAPGYHLWHQLADHRRDFEVDQFTKSDADSFLAIAQKESDVRLKPKVRDFIIEHYGGYPWLLKKLTRYFIEGTHQESASVSSSFVDLKTLFERELEEVSQNDRRCIDFIAHNSPIEYGLVTDRFGDQSISHLLSTRLIINVGGKLTLYWDIFRDYIISGETPYIPNTYVPTMYPDKAKAAIEFLCSNRRTTYSDIGIELGISSRTADNAVRDLMNMNLITADRKGGSIEATFSSTREATARLIEFSRGHAFYAALMRLLSHQDECSRDALRSEALEEYAFLGLDDKVYESYLKRMVNYFVQLRLVNDDGRTLRDNEPITDLHEFRTRGRRLGKDRFFRAEAPPERVIELLRILTERGTIQRRILLDRGYRNALTLVLKTELAYEQSGVVKPAGLLMRRELETIVREKVRQREPFSGTDPILYDRKVKGWELARYLSDKHDLNWTDPSCRRYGPALRQWARWLES